MYKNRIHLSSADRDGVFLYTYVFILHIKHEKIIVHMYVHKYLYSTCFPFFMFN